MAKKKAAKTKPKGRPVLTGEAKIKDDARRDWVDEWLTKNGIDAKPKEVEEAMLKETDFENDKGDTNWYQFVTSRKLALRKKMGITDRTGQPAKTTASKGIGLAAAAKLCDDLKLDAGHVKTLLDSLKNVDIKEYGKVIDTYSQFVDKAGSKEKADELIALIPK